MFCACTYTYTWKLLFVCVLVHRIEAGTLNNNFLVTNFLSDKNLCTASDEMQCTYIVANQLLTYND